MSLRFRSCIVVSCLVAGLALLTPPAQAQGQPQTSGDWSASLLLKGGTLGVGPELDVRIPHSAFGVRADIDGLAFSDNDMLNGRLSHNEPAYGYNATLRYGGTVTLLNGGLTGDYYPFGNGFRLSLGIIGNGNEVNLHAQPVGTLRIGATTYTGPAPGSMSGNATFNAVAPMVGLGYSALVWGRLRVSLDAGAMYQGDPHLSYQLTGSITQLPSVATDAERERQRIQREVNYPVYPVVMLGIGWQF